MLDAETEELRWAVRPCAEDPLRAAVAVAATLATGVAAYVAFGHLCFALLGVAVVGLAVSSFFTTTSYALTAEGAVAKSWWFTQRRPWSDFRAVFADEDGILLSPSRRPTRLAATRGLYLRCSGNLEAVRAFAEGRLAAASPEEHGQEASPDNRG